jgi:hypothetical protein
MQRAEDKKRAESFKPGQRLPASWVQKVENFISSFKVLSGGQFIWDGRTAALQIWPSSSSLKFALGMESYTVDANAGTSTATMREGLVTVGNVTTQIERRDIAVSGSPAYIVMRIERRTRSAGWIDTTISAIPQNNAQYMYVPFVEFQIAPGATFHSLYLIHHAGSLYLP